jgi:D-alanyl-D-alanine carboxypeptidase/D-alanyl-D-alanine-endopeptidase (penicillin-binding protein 4)
MTRSQPLIHPLAALLLGSAIALPCLTPAAQAQGASYAGVASPALPPVQALRPAPLASLSSLPPPLALPQLQAEVSCPALQQRIASLIGSEAYAWSVSVADPGGHLLADVNGLRPRVPASNQKLISTAFALDRLGPDHRLTTQLWRLGDGSFRLTGQGDPDLAVPHLQRFAKLALTSGGSSGLPAGSVKLQLAEEPAQGWWPQGWSYGDRAYAYGAPITRLAITSNAIEDAVSNPPSRLRTLLDRAVKQQGGSAQFELVSATAPIPGDAVLVHEEPSTSMHGLLSLANTESHNFTAEVLLRTAAGTWNVDQAAQIETAWLNQQGLPMQGVRIFDGSGLDRSNRVTSRFLTALLLRMDQHPYSRDFLASMAIAGQRGTLRNLFSGTPLEGRLYAKTGTLTGVRAISGVLQTNDGPRYVSAISNGAGTPNQTIGQILRQVMNVSLCSQGI